MFSHRLFQTYFVVFIAITFTCSDNVANAQETPPISQQQGESRCRQPTKQEVTLLCLPSQGCRYYMTLIAPSALRDPNQDVGRGIPGLLTNEILVRERFTFPDLTTCVPVTDPDLFLCNKSTHRCHFLRWVPSGKTIQGQLIYEVKRWTFSLFDVIRETDFFTTEDVFNEPISWLALRITPEKI